MGQNTRQESHAVRTLLFFLFWWCVLLRVLSPKAKRSIENGEVLPMELPPKTKEMSGWDETGLGDQLEVGGAKHQASEPC